MIQLKRIQVKNFKCFSGKVDLELGKLTLLTGANSTGKSSLMYSVLGALQSPRFPFEYSANGRYINMGNYSEMVFGHDKSLPIEIAFSLVEDDVSIDIITTWCNGDANDQAVLCKYEVDSSNFHFIVNPKGNGRNSEFSLSIDYQPQINFARNSRNFELFMSDLFRFAEFYKSDYKDDTSVKETISKEIIAGYEQHTIVNNVLLRIDEKGIASCPDNIQATVAFNIANRLVIDIIHRYQNKMNFISSYRLAADRIYLEESLENGKIQASGKGFVNQILHWREGNRLYYESLIDVLRSVGVLYDIEPMRIGGGQFKVGVAIHKDGPKASLSDVGFGISQLLPVIVGDIELGEQSTLFTAQPEIHLHPNAQANLADYLVGQINKGKNYVIETHSEYLLNRIRLAIVKEKLKEEDVRVYYLSQKKDNSKLYPIRFTKTGKIEGAPKDFFETYMIDVMNIAMEAVGNEA